MTLFGAPASARELPVAPFRYFGDYGTAPQGYCLNADPVHLRADTSGLLLFDASSLSVSASEATQLSSTLQTLFTDDGWSLQTASPEHWYLTGATVPDLYTTPLAAVRGRAVGAFLPHGRAAAAWLNRGNEIQMLLHNHTVNLQRAARGAPAINSVWLWGGGNLPRPGTRKFDQVYSNDSLIRGLARWSNSDCRALPTDARELLDSKPDGPVLLSLDSCQRAAAYDDFQAWNSAVQSCERDWFAPLFEALSQGRIQQLELLPLNDSRYRLRRRDAWRFWRRVHSYRTLL